MMEFFRKYFVLFFLGFLVVVLVLLKIFFGNTKTNEIENKTITPTPSQVIIPTISEYQSDNPESEKSEITVLPYMGKKMEVAGYLRPGVLVVLVEKEEDKVEAEVEFKEWLERNPSFKSNSFEFQISKLN